MLLNRQWPAADGFSSNAEAHVLRSPVDSNWNRRQYQIWWLPETTAVWIRVRDRAQARSQCAERHFTRAMVCHR